MGCGRDSRRHWTFGRAQSENHGPHGVFLERAVHQRYPEFPVRSGVHSWEEYLPPLAENLERLVETYEGAAAAAAGG